MKWKSTKDIIDYFNLDLDKHGTKEIRASLVQLLAEYHPDKSGGEFSSDEQKIKYEEVQHAINDLETH